MPFKFVVLGVLLVILLSLGSALIHMVRGKGSSEQMARALTIRIGLSLLLVLLLIAAAAMGWITPHGMLPVPAGTG